MAAMLEELNQFLFYSLPMLLLFGVFLIGYYFAWTDFRPKKAGKDEEFFAVSNSPFYEPDKKKRELTDSELGLHDMNDYWALPAPEQRRLKMREITVSFSADNPESTAEVIKSWLRS